MRIDPMMIPILLYLLKATAILLLALGVAMLLRRASAGTRHLVWLAAVVVVLALPAFGAVLPDLRVLPLPTIAVAPSEPAERFGEVAMRSLDGSTPVTSGAFTGTGATAPRDPQISAEPAARTPLGDRVATWVATADLWRTLFFLWIAGALLVLGRLARSAYSLRRILASAQPLDDADWTTPLYEAADRLNLERAPRLLQSARIAMPFACGLVEPTIVVPASATEWTAPRRRAVLFHELAHIRRRDLFGHALGRLACALYWMHPLVWAAAYRLRAESERACDDLVLSTGTPASEYADHLLQILVSVRANDAPAVALPMGRRREFEGRLLAILDPALRRHRPTLAHAAVLTVFSLCAAGLVALAPVDASGSAAHLQVPTEQRLAIGLDVGGPVDLAAEGQGEQAFIPRPPRPEPLPAGAPDPQPVPEPQADSYNQPHDLQDVIENVATEFGHGVAGLVESVAGTTLQAVLGTSATQEKDVALLARLLATDSSAEVRRTAAWGLHDSGDPRATGALIRALGSDSDAEVREMAAWALHETNSAPVLAALTAAARDSNAEVRASAVWGLGHLATADPQTLAVINGALRDPDPEVATRAAWAIGTLHPSAAPAALYEDALRHSDPEVRVAAAWALGQIADPASEASLGRALREERESEPLKAVTWALLQLGPIEPQALEDLLASDDAELRAQAIRILAGAGSAFHPWPWPWPEPRVFP